MFSCGAGLAGYGDGSIENSLIAREIVPSYITKIQYMTDLRYSATTWTDISDRVMSFTKNAANTDIFVSYTDTLGYLMTGGGEAGGWRLVVDGTAKPASVVYSQNGGGWYIWPMQLFWVLQGLGTGSHSLKMQVFRNGGSSEMLQGWPNQDSNTFMVRFLHTTFFSLVCCSVVCFSV